MRRKPVKHRPYAGAQARARANLQGHVTHDRPSRNFDFRDPKKGSHYAFSLCWQPGTLTLVGDLGELTLVHYHALANLRGGLAWATSSDLDYLLSKSARRPSYDPDATLEEIIQFANEPAFDFFNGPRQERPRAAIDRPLCDSDEEWAQVLADWAEQKALYQAFTTRGSWQYGSGFREEKIVAPDGWHLWHRIWAATQYDHGEPKEAIFMAKGRTVLKDALARRLEYQHEAVDLIRRIGLDDYYGTERWTFQDIQQIEAIRFGAAKALSWLDGEEHFTWRDPEPGFVPPAVAA